MKYLALILLLSSCQTIPLQKTENYDTRIVTWHRTNIMPRICQLIINEDEKLLGCAVWSKIRCDIYAPEPIHLNDVKGFKVLGHEFLHCFDGEFHD